MNVITICESNWVNTHLRQFIKLARKNMPDAKYHLLLVHQQDEDYSLDVLDQFDMIQTLHTSKVLVTGLPGPSKLDHLRAECLRYFDLEEGLYTDPDVDILTDISDVKNYVTDKTGVLLTKSPVALPGVEASIGNLMPSADDVKVTYNCGFMYLRQNYLSAYLQAMQELHDNDLMRFSSVPGTTVWNLALRRAKWDYGLVDYAYNTIAWDVENLHKAKVIHFSGPQMKLLRFKYNYDEFPEYIKMDIKPNDDTSEEEEKAI